jgi:hypothetical protein
MPVPLNRGGSFGRDRCISQARRDALAVLGFVLAGPEVQSHASRERTSDLAASLGLNAASFIHASQRVGNRRNPRIRWGNGRCALISECGAPAR